MGRVLTEATIENIIDIWDVQRGVIPTEKARRVNVSNALVDTGATTLALPTDLIQQLGLVKSYEKQAISSQGMDSVSIYSAARLTIMDRFCTVDVIEVSNDVPVLIGQIPLEMLDLVVDLQSRKLIGNPAHGGEQVLELY